MSIVAFAMLAGMLTVYVVLDGYDLGVGTILHLFGRTRAERAAALASIGPYWNGNEVWLIASGGVLFALFPRAYAAAFSGFYLPLMVALWLLMGRGIALELRNHLDGELWQGFWDTVFSLSSALLTLVFGVALGNLVRGLPLDRAGFFTGSFALLLNPYALAVGVLAVLTLGHHGLAYVCMRVPGSTERAQAAQRRLWWLVVIAYVAVTAATAAVHPLGDHRRVAAIGLFALSVVALAAARLLGARGSTAAAFAASCAFIVTLLVTAAATIFPYLVPASGGGRGISVFDDVPSPATLAVLLSVVGVGLAAVVAYTLFAVRRLA